MQNPQQYKQIEDKIKELIHIKKSDFLVAFCPSCENSFSSITAKVDTQSWCPHCDNNALCSPWKEDTFGIQYRPITLNDLLLVIGKDKLLECKSKIYQDSNIEKILIHYDLTKPFNSQNEELYTFIHQLLCK